jgi:hypothetical protein
LADFKQKKGDFLFEVQKNYQHLPFAIQREYTFRLICAFFSLVRARETAGGVSLLPLTRPEAKYRALFRTAVRGGLSGEGRGNLL